MEALSAEKREAQRAVGVWAENWDIVAAFALVLTQWRVASLADGRVLYIGLDYTAARIRLAGARTRVTPALWDGLATMEAAFSAEMNSR